MNFYDKSMTRLQQIKYTAVYRTLKRAYGFFNSRFYPTAHIYHKLYCLKHRDFELKRVQLKSLEDYCECNGRNKTKLASGDKFTVYSKQYWKDDEAGTKEGTYDVQEVFAAELADVSVIGGYSFLIKNSFLLEPNYTPETARTFVWTNPVLKIQIGSMGEIRYRKTEITFDKALFLCGSAYSNYYHFLMEILPRLALSEQKNIYPDWPILADAGLKEIPSLYAALRMTNVNQHQIIWVELNTLYHVRKLAYVSPVTWAPMNMKHSLWPKGKDYVLCKQAIQCMKELITKQAAELEVKRLYVARYQTKNVRLLNDREMAELCTEYGFQVIFPEKLSFIEQVAYFHSAEYIMTCAGAGCTNAIFCREGTTMYMVVPRRHESILWPTVIINAGVRLLLIDAKIVKEASYAAGDGFEVDLQEVKKILESL